MADAIRLPKDRADQLRQFAQGMDDSTISAAVGNLLKLAREQGLVQHGIPSVTINAFPDGLAIRLGEGKTVGFSTADAKAIASTLRDFLENRTESKRGEIVVRMSKSGSFSVLGRGNGVKIAMPVGAEPFIFTRDLVEELADLIDHAADQVVA